VKCRLQEIPHAENWYSKKVEAHGQKVNTIYTANALKLRIIIIIIIIVVVGVAVAALQLGALSGVMCVPLSPSSIIWYQ